MKKQTPIFIALSGGVDSAVVARLLQEEYETVIGVSHRHWPESRCCSTECIDRCADQCRDMGIPYYPIDCIVEFTQAIVDDFIATYERGQTPNPCVRCNQTIRFDLMMNKLFEEHPELKTDDYKIATGHYVRVEMLHEVPALKQGLDKQKDQSYMLYRLSSEQLSRCVFPLGSYQKSEVRALAEKWNLKSAKAGDSMDVCFVNDTYQIFLDEYTGQGQKRGLFVNTEGEVMGEHKGVPYYTRGQRKGLGLSGGPWYVIHTNTKTGQVVLGVKEELMMQEFDIRDTCWNRLDLKDKIKARVQLRYHSILRDVTITRKEEDLFHLKLVEPCEDICPGQSAVIYDGDRILGGGVICPVL
jgi:tRNA-specific 2-thiouridylase